MQTTVFIPIIILFFSKKISTDLNKSRSKKVHMLHFNEMSQNFLYSITVFFMICVCEQKLGYFSCRFYHFLYLTGLFSQVF